MDRLIVDGNNVLHAHPLYGPMLEEDFEGARARFVSDMAGFAHAGVRVVVVFDGGGSRTSDGAPHHVGPLTVIFSPAGSDADTVIEALAARSRLRGERAVVVTSDVATRNAVASGSVSVRSTGAFLEDLAAEAADRRSRRSSGGTRVAVADRVDPDVAGALARWARGHAPGAAARERVDAAE